MHRHLVLDAIALECARLVDERLTAKDYALLLLLDGGHVADQRAEVGDLCLEIKRKMLNWLYEFASLMMISIASASEC